MYISFLKNSFLFFQLTKPGIARMQLLTVCIGYVVASLGVFSFEPFLFLLFGTYLSASSGGVLNHYLERHFDSKMFRTKNRPLPLGKVNPLAALFLGLFLGFVGILLLCLYVNLITAVLSGLTLCFYLCLYTPLKRKTWLNTLVGAIPGAVPILGGWAAATGSLHSGAWILFCILFTWQLPHFFALAVLYQEDYERGGFQMLPSVDMGMRTPRQTVFYIILMIFCSIVPSIVGLSGFVYGVGVFVLGCIFLWGGILFAKKNTKKSAKNLFVISIFYLPLWLLLILLDFYLNSLV